MDHEAYAIFCRAFKIKCQPQCRLSIEDEYFFTIAEIGLSVMGRSRIAIVGDVHQIRDQEKQEP